MDTRPLEQVSGNCHTSADDAGQILPRRRRLEAVAEQLGRDLQTIADGQAALSERLEHLRAELKTDIARIERRVIRIVAERAGRKPG